MNIWPYPIRVAGVSFRMKDNSELLSNEVWIERVKNNPHDANAVGVWSIRDKQFLFIGYIPREIAAQIRDDQLPSKGEIVWRAVEGLGIRVKI